MKKDTKDTIQWHPAFQASIQIEFEAESEKLTFEPEHLLSKKPMQMDELIIKVAENEYRNPQLSTCQKHLFSYRIMFQKSKPEMRALRLRKFREKKVSEDVGIP